MCEHKNPTVSFFKAAAPYDQPIVETMNAKQSSVYLDRCLHFVTLRPRLVTWGRCHGTQERAAKVLASWEDKRCVDLPLSSCALAVQSVPHTASSTVVSVVEGNVHDVLARHRKVCKMQELEETMVRQELAVQGPIKT